MTNRRSITFRVETKNTTREVWIGRPAYSDARYSLYVSGPDWANPQAIVGVNFRVSADPSKVFDPSKSVGQTLVPGQDSCWSEIFVDRATYREISDALALNAISYVTIEFDQEIDFPNDASKFVDIIAFNITTEPE